MHDAAVLQQYCVGVGAADIDADPPHAPSLTLPRKRGRGDRRRAAIGWGLIEHRAEIEVVAEGARPDMVEALRRQKYRWRRQCDDRHPHAVADRLGAERVPRYRIEYADQIRRHRNRLALFADDAPRHDPFVLKRDLQTRATVLIEPLDDAAAAQKSFGSAPRHIDDLAAEQLFPLRLIQNRRDRILVAALRLAHPPAEIGRASGRERLPR